ncbi:MAG: hypothetical protein GY796_35790 [Chloroflexi bacterium]|nr:hypothetical protein [Chloroflexota bacterium]
MITIEEFLQASPEEVAKIAPQTVMWGAGGTRRDIVLNNISLEDIPQMALFSMNRLADTAEILFKLGVRNILVITVHSRQLVEKGKYRDYIIKGTKYAIGECLYPHYKRLNCRAHLVGHKEVPELTDIAAELEAKTADNGQNNIWWLASVSYESVWEKTIAAAQGAKNQAEVIRNYYGADLPPAELFLSYGKPFIEPEILPLPLIAETHCYWYQRPGYRLTEQEVRTIFYDHAYLRNTWIPDKMARYAEVDGQRDIWSRNDIIGLGQRFGSFWYPLPEGVHCAEES